MKTFIVTLLTLVVAGAMLLPEPADAKRSGGGKSFGRQYSQPAKPAQPPAAQQTPRQQAAPGAAGQRPSGASRWLGPLAGLAAGGLLASLFFGDAFEGFQIMDFLLIALLIFGGVMLFRMLRQRGAGGARPAHAGAGAGPMPHGGVGYDRAEAGGPIGGSTGLGGLAGASQDPAAQGADEAPTWFDAAGFVEGAKTHFIRLQAAWDRSDFADIRDYTSPQMYAELKREREALGDSPNDTEVVRIDAELRSVQRDGDQVVASVRFNGLIREETSGTANPMDEVWHVAHRWDNADGDWIIVGIQQTGQ
jgi:predicted lipid-binding transport protein (Tim44 family)